MVDEPLFDLDPAWYRRPLGAAARRTRVQRALILVGVHPLTVSLRRVLRLHPDAPRNPNDRKALGPRCGTCRYLEPLDVGGHVYKCWIRNGNGMANRVTRGHASTIRRWFPGCKDYQGGNVGQANEEEGGSTG